MTDIPPPTDESSSASEKSERKLSDLFRKALERGLEAGLASFNKADDTLRHAASEAKAPREIASVVFSQVDELKNSALKVVAGEIRRFLQQLEVSKELRNVLSDMTLRVNAEISFSPKDKSATANPSSHSPPPDES